MRIWKGLLLIYSKLDVVLELDSKPRRFCHALTAAEIDHALESFAGFPELVAQLSEGAATIEPRIERIVRPLASLTRRERNGAWPSPDDTRIEIDELAAREKVDSIFVFWPQHDFIHGDSVPGDAWGLGMGPSDWSNGATYAAVANARPQAWKNEARGEVWLHEWLHGVCYYFAQAGCAMPERDADGAELHGYVRSPLHGWTDYYRDLMNGRVLAGDVRLGIPPEAWREGRTA